MRALPSPLRKQLEMSVLAARRAAESASRAAIENLGVFADRRPEHLDANQAALRNGLRAKWRQFGRDRELLVAECAYEQWHRLLFARFLAENGLLLHPQYKAPVTLADCEDLAAELGEPDAWSVAARFAAEILPGIFRLDDPCVRLRLAPEGRHALEEILDALPAEIFAADDALGWVYQFWQKDKVNEINASERKIGGADLGPVTQLFTENYMVRFLLENSLGAWWAARHPDSPLVKGFDYLRLDDDGCPAAGAFDGWPERVAELTVMDPCCGSGHFLVEAFMMLWQMRAEEEDRTPVNAQDAVLRENLFGLELDARCVQIAMFAVALQAWKAGGRWRQLPVPNIACSGIPLKADIDEWKAVAGGDARLENAVARLGILFREADTLGSLIDPKHASQISDPSDLQLPFDEVEWTILAPLLAKVGNRATDPALSVFGAEAVGSARAADLLSRTYTCVATNVPYLSRNSQGPTLRGFLTQQYPAGAGDLGVAFHSRLVEFTSEGGTVAAVLPANWLTLGSYENHRRAQLAGMTWATLALLGARAFSGVSGEVVRVCLLVVTNAPPTQENKFSGIDVSAAESAAKAQALKSSSLVSVRQERQLSNPDARILITDLGNGDLLQKYVGAYTGTQTGDFARYGRKFWELPPHESWVRQMTTVSQTVPWGGRENVIHWEHGRGALSREPSAYVRGRSAWGRPGVLVSRMGNLPCTLYAGEFFDDNCGVLIPAEGALLPPLWAFVSSAEYGAAVRSIDDTIKVTNKTLAKVVFDVDRWRKVAEEADPLPEPFSGDPTQWLFEGRPAASTSPLQVAVALLVGYRWPEHIDPDDIDAFADSDGIACLPSVAGEPPAADRVQQLLGAAFGAAWSPAKVRDLLEQAGSKKKNFADWLRDEFFKQHCTLFGNRPFVWHIWDGQRDGFSTLINYHRLDRKMLEKLTYTYLGQDWVERQRAELRDEVAGAETRLSAALGLQRKLEAILDGEAPFDIYVRWKEMHEQAIGWEPDLNDGVRLNVRPFVEAGVLRTPFNIHWRKDRGRNPDGSERENDKHLTLAQKIDARNRARRA